MNHSISEIGGQASSSWSAPRLVALTGAGASDGGIANNLTEGKFVTIGTDKFEGNDNFVVGSG